METFTAPDGARIAYESRGSANAKAIVFLHGWHARASVWQAPLLGFAAEYHCIAPDLRGFGNSRACAGPFTVEQASDDVRALLEALAIDRAIVVGHSMGGTIAQRFAADHPERARALVLVAPVPASGLPLSDRAKAFFRSTPGDIHATGAFIDALAFDGAFEPAIAAELRAFAAAGSPDAAGAWFESWAFVTERVAELIPGSRLVVIPETSHYPQLERPALVMGEIERFLADLG
jgi:pimeloyl-ACP methyl ester carboxylesterase